VFENGVLRRIFRPKSDKVIREWRKLLNEGLNDLYSPPTIVEVIKSRTMRWAEHVARIGWGEACTGIWWGKLKKRSLGRLRSGWEDNIKMDLQEVGCGVMNWIGLAQDTDRWLALVNAVMNLRDP
jgi:hypothetical protein